MDKKTEMLKQLILLKYKSFREFARFIDIPQSTLMSSLNNGIDGTAISTVIKMCKGLNISVDDLADEKYDKILTPELQQLIDNSKHLAPEQLAKLNEFINTLK